MCLFNWVICCIKRPDAYTIYVEHTKQILFLSKKKVTFFFLQHISNQYHNVFFNMNFIRIQTQIRVWLSFNILIFFFFSRKYNNLLHYANFVIKITTHKLFLYLLNRSFIFIIDFLCWICFFLILIKKKNMSIYN